MKKLMAVLMITLGVQAFASTATCTDAAGKEILKVDDSGITFMAEVDGGYQYNFFFRKFSGAYTTILAQTMEVETVGMNSEYNMTAKLVMNPAAKMFTIEIDKKGEKTMTVAQCTEMEQTFIKL
jgi:hypothetical protein